MKFDLSSRNSEILHFGVLLLQNSYKVSAKKVQKTYLSWQWMMIQSLKKNWLVVSNMTWRIWWIFTEPLKSPKISLWWAIFVQSIWSLSQKKYRGATFNDTEQWCKILLRPDLFVWKMARGIGWTFIRAPKSLKNCTLMGSFCPKHMMFQLEHFREIMCHDTEGCCKI